MGVLCEICDRRANQRRIEPAFIGERQTNKNENVRTEIKHFQWDF